MSTGFTRSSGAGMALQRSNAGQGDMMTGLMGSSGAGSAYRGQAFGPVHHPVPGYRLSPRTEQTLARPLPSTEGN